MDYLDLYAQTFGITTEKAEKHRLVENENGTRTAKKELIGEAIIKKYHIFDKLFPNNNGFKKISDKKHQKAGVDYEVYLGDDTIYIDLKSLVGPAYTMAPEDYADNDIDEPVKKAVALEVYQNHIFTNSKGKLTDYFLFTIADKDGIFYYLMSYDTARSICMEHIHKYRNVEIDGTVYAKAVTDGRYKLYTSNNGSGEYIKVPVDAVKVDE